MVLYYFDYYSLVMPFAIKKGDAFNCILIFQDEFDYVETATVLHKFRNFFFFP